MLSGCDVTDLADPSCFISPHWITLASPGQSVPFVCLCVHLNTSSVQSINTLPQCVTCHFQSPNTRLMSPVLAPVGRCVYICVCVYACLFADMYMSLSLVSYYPPWSVFCVYLCCSLFNNAIPTGVCSVCACMRMCVCVCVYGSVCL